MQMYRLNAISKHVGKIDRFDFHFQWMLKMLILLRLLDELLKEDLEKNLSSLRYAELNNLKDGEK